MRSRIATFEGYRSAPPAYGNPYGRVAYRVAPLLPRAKRSGRILPGPRRAGYRVKKARNTKAQVKFGKCSRRCSGRTSRKFATCMRKCMRVGRRKSKR